MTGRGVVRLVVVARLRIDSGQAPHGGARLRYPTADYHCLLCDFTDSASGDAVPRFVATVRAQHATRCPKGDHHR